MRHATPFAVFVGFAMLALFGCSERPSPDTITGPAPVSPGVSKAGTEEQASVEDPGNGHVVYTLSNSAAGNSVLRFTGEGGGSLVPSGTFSTGGNGTGAGLGSQGALVQNGRFLYAVNAGSNDISVLAEDQGGLHVTDRVPSGGTMPISLTVHGDFLYVLNAGGSGGIAGFSGARHGMLSPLAGSMLPLSGAAAGPAQIEFNPRGDLLVVTEKATNKIDVYVVAVNGTASGPIVQNSTGNTPFGFEFTPHGDLVISDAFGGMAGQSALSSYSLTHQGQVNLVTGPVADGQTAACWVAITGDGRYAYTTNNGSNNISGYRIGHDGSVSLFADGGKTAVTDAKPIDLAFSHGSKYLYALNAGSNSITVYRLEHAEGGLTFLGRVSGLPMGAAGLAAN